MKRLTKEELKNILDLHKKWLNGESDGVRAELCSIDLTCAKLSGADLSGAKLDGIVYNENTAFFALQCPEEGSFIGYKKAINDYEEFVIVKLQITEDAKRSSATSRKCRCSKAKILSITSIDGKIKYDFAYSKHDPNFVYKVGETVEATDFDEDRWNECSTGIHFFVTRDEAVRYF